MVTIANLGTIQEAQRLQLELAAAGIDAFIPDEVSAGVAPHLFMTRTGVRVQVAPRDEDAALELLAQG